MKRILGDQPFRRALDLHVGAVILLGGLTIATSVTALALDPPPSEWVLFSLFGLVAGVCAVKIPGVNALVSASDTFFISSAMLFGPAPAMLSLALDSAGLAYRRGYGFKRLVFNATAPALSLWLATHTFEWMLGDRSLVSDSKNVAALIPPLAAMTAVYFGLNSGLTAIAIALESRVALLPVWWRFAPLSLNYIAAASAAFCIVTVMRYGGPMAAVAVVPLVVVFHVALRAILGRLADAELHVAKVERLYMSTIETLATAIEAKDDVTHDHIRRVQRLALGLANALGIRDDEMIKAIKAAALLHDMGKLAVPEYILNKPGKLTDPEFEQMKLHVDVGADILSAIDFPYPVVPIVRAHHERWDGTGYPRRLRGEDIPIGARILSVVDCYDALTSDRPYRRALSREQALAIIIGGRGTMYDPGVVDAFVAVCDAVAAEALEPLPHSDVLRRIGRAKAASPPVPPPSPEVVAPLSDDLLAIVSLSNVVCGEGTIGDALALASVHLSRMLGDATCVIYVRDSATGHLVARCATGLHAAPLRELTIAVGERLTGWVASSRQTMVNSDAMLDLFDRGIALDTALSSPLTDGDRVVGVFTAYASAPRLFTDDESRVVRMMAPHVGRIVGAAHRSELRNAGGVSRVTAGADLRVVVRR
jgi:putative nucleotidyltransferase with HDIG domain